MLLQDFRSGSMEFGRDVSALCAPVLKHIEIAINVRVFVALNGPADCCREACKGRCELDQGTAACFNCAESSLEPDELQEMGGVIIVNIVGVFT